MIPVNRHRIWNVLADAALIALAWWLAFWLRFDHGVLAPYHRLMVDTIGIAVVLKLGMFVVFGFYNRWWRYVSTRDMWGAARGVAVASLLTDLVLYAFPPNDTSRLPRRIAVRPPVSGYERPSARCTVPAIFSSSSVEPVGRSIPELVPIPSSPRNRAPGSVSSAERSSPSPRAARAAI